MWLLFLACLRQDEGPPPPPGEGPAGGGPAKEEPKSPPPPGEGPQPLPLSANPGNSELTWVIDGTESRSEGFRVETDEEGTTFRGAVHLEGGEKLEFTASDVTTTEAGTTAIVHFETQGNEHDLTVPLTLSKVEGGLDLALATPIEVDGVTIAVDTKLVFRPTE